MKKLLLFLVATLCISQLNLLNAQTMLADGTQDTQQSYIETTQLQAETPSTPIQQQNFTPITSNEFASIPSQEVPSFKYSDMMVDGKVLTTMGVIFTTIGSVMLPVGGVIYAGYLPGDYKAWAWGIVYMSVGAGFTVAGISCLTAGTIKIKKARRNNVSMTYNVAPTGAQLSLKF